MKWLPRQSKKTWLSAGQRLSWYKPPYSLEEERQEGVFAVGGRPEQKLARDRMKVQRKASKAPDDRGGQVGAAARSTAGLEMFTCTWNPSNL